MTPYWKLKEMNLLKIRELSACRFEMTRIDNPKEKTILTGDEEFFVNHAKENKYEGVQLSMLYQGLEFRLFKDEEVKI